MIIQVIRAHSKPRIRRAWLEQEYMGFTYVGWDCDGAFGTTPKEAYKSWVHCKWPKSTYVAGPNKGRK